MLIIETFYIYNFKNRFNFKESEYMLNNIMFAGWSSVNITPIKKVSLYGQYYERISEGVHDSLYATALAIESRNNDGSSFEQTVMISCDIVGIQKILLNKLRERLAGKINSLDVNKILMFATHTHTAPSIVDDSFDRLNWTEWKKLSKDEYMHPNEYLEFLVERLEQVVIEAWNNRKPSKVSIELGHAVVGHCRRTVFDDRAVMYASPDTANFLRIEGPSDHGVELMYFWDMSDKLTGVIVNVACPAQVVEGMNVISADYFGAARRQIKERISEDVYVLPQIVPAGDQSPRDLIRRGKSENNMSNDFEGMEELGSRVADAVIKKLESARKKAQSDLIFNHSVEDIYLPIRKVTQGEVEWAQKNYDDLMKNYNSESEIQGRDLVKLIDYRAIFVRKKAQEKASFFKIELHAIRLGDAAFITNPFELYIEYGLRIKARSKAKQTFAIQLSCGKGAYLPTRKALAGGSYGANVSNGIVGHEGGDLLVEHSVTAINRFWGEKSYLENWRFGS
jgi:hypothetical protein